MKAAGGPGKMQTKGRAFRSFRFQLLANSVLVGELFEVGGHGGIGPVNEAAHEAHEVAVAVEDEEAGQHVGGKRRGNDEVGIMPGGEGLGELRLLRELRHALRVLVERDGNEADAALGLVVLRLEFGHERRAALAGGAPGTPDVDDHELVLELRKRLRIACEVLVAVEREAAGGAELDEVAGDKGLFGDGLAVLLELLVEGGKRGRGALGADHEGERDQGFLEHVGESPL